MRSETMPGMFRQSLRITCATIAIAFGLLLCRTDLEPAAAEPQVKTEKHPFVPAIKIAKNSLGKLSKIEGYTAYMVKRERIKGKLLPLEAMFVKVRHNPFSVYIRMIEPKKAKGREVVFVQGKNDDKLLVHTPGLQDKLVGTVALKPKSRLAMKGCRYPLTDIGMKNLLTRLIEVGEQDMKHGEAEVRFFKNVKLGERTCTLMEFTHPKQRDHFRFHKARIYIDDELQIPVRYEAYNWPSKPGGKPILLEQYTYHKVKLDQKLEDVDFDPKNPKYKFPEK